MRQLIRLACCSLLVVACGAAPPKTPAAVAAKPVAHAAHGVRADLIGFGLSAQFPRATETHTGRDKSVQTASVQLQGPPFYQLTAVSTMGRDRPQDSEWYESLRKKMKLEKRRDVKLAGFRGVELAGLYEKKPILTRLFAVGDTLFVTEVVGEAGDKLEEPGALQFLDSVQLELPWRIYASPTAKVSVMVPSHAIQLDKTEPNGHGRSSSMAFFLGGEAQLTYWVSGEELVDRNPEVTDGQLLEAAISGMQSRGVDISWQAPIQAAGVRGREFLATDKQAHLMGRILLSDHFVYLLFISATTKEALKSADSSKFYGSFVAY
ncbi:MAG TPA: hypothetical protein VHP33_21205 [Polyangiaceae bacterium]|nr:hypothetical protein [Polyangiaceae bacterium]